MAFVSRPVKTWHINGCTIRCDRSVYEGDETKVPAEKAHYQLFTFYVSSNNKKQQVEYAEPVHHLADAAVTAGGLEIERKLHIVSTHPDDHDSVTLTKSDLQQVMVYVEAHDPALTRGKPIEIEDVKPDWPQVNRAIAIGGNAANMIMYHFDEAERRAGVDKVSDITALFNGVINDIAKERENAPMAMDAEAADFPVIQHAPAAPIPVGFPVYESAPPPVTTVTAVNKVYRHDPLTPEEEKVIRGRIADEVQKQVRGGTSDDAVKKVTASLQDAAVTTLKSGKFKHRTEEPVHGGLLLEEDGELDGALKAALNDSGLANLFPPSVNMPHEVVELTNRALQASRSAGK